MATSTKNRFVIDNAIAGVRRFNRFYTRHLGLLGESILQSQFSLTEVRVLYELAHRASASASDVAKDLGLDPGYLSRILRGFDARGLVQKTPGLTDRRRSRLELTEKGKDIFAQLDRRQGDEVALMLSPLSPARQDELCAAMRSIETILSPERGLTSYVLRPPQPGDMGWVVHRHGTLYWQEHGYDERFEALVAEIVANFVQDLDPRRDRCWIAERDGENLGCVFLVKKSKTVAKLRLLLVEPSARGSGVGGRLITECIRFARQAGYKKITLWTQSELDAARHLYEKAGFRLVKKTSHDSWSRRGLVAEVWELKL